MFYPWTLQLIFPFVSPSRFSFCIHFAFQMLEKRPPSNWNFLSRMNRKRKVGAISFSNIVQELDNPPIKVKLFFLILIFFSHSLSFSYHIALSVQKFCFVPPFIFLSTFKNTQLVLNWFISKWLFQLICWTRGQWWNR